MPADTWFLCDRPCSVLAEGFCDCLHRHFCIGLFESFAKCPQWYHSTSWEALQVRKCLGAVADQFDLSLSQRDSNEEQWIKRFIACGLKSVAMCVF